MKHTIQHTILIFWGLLASLQLATGQTNITLCLTNNSLLNGTLVQESDSNLVVTIDGLNTVFGKEQIRWQQRKIVKTPPSGESVADTSRPIPANSSPPVATSGNSPELVAGQAAMTSPTDYTQALEAVRQKVIAPRKLEAYKEMKMVDGKWQLVVDPDSKAGAERYKKANGYYDQTMSGVMNGSVSQDSLVQQAKSVLADCDKYKEERKNDPQYEKEIATLREFVRRSEAGEKFNFTPAP